MPVFRLPEAALRRLLPAALLAGAALCLPAGGARADACSDCPAPSRAELEAQPGFVLGTRPLLQWPYLPVTDSLETFAAECAYSASSAPDVVPGPTWSILRATGEVLNCPWAKTSTEVAFELEEGDSTEWSVEGEAGASLSAAALSLAAKLKAGYVRGSVRSEVRALKTTIEAQPGHRVPWEGYFEVGPLQLTIDFAVTRRWSWWTKHPNSGDVVLASGSIWMDCGGERVTLKRQAAFHAWVETGDRPCGVPELSARPPAPPPGPPPVVTPGTGPAPGPVPPQEPGQPGGDPVPDWDEDEPRPDLPQPHALPPPADAPPGEPVAPPPPLPVPPPVPTVPDPSASDGLGEAPTGRFLLSLALGRGRSAPRGRAPCV